MNRTHRTHRTPGERIALMRDAATEIAEIINCTSCTRYLDDATLGRLMMVQRAVEDGVKAVAQVMRPAINENKLNDLLGDVDI